MANKDFKVKNGIDVQTPIPVSMGGTGQTSTTNTLNSLLPVQTDNTNKVLQTNGTATSWVTLPNGYSKGDTASRPESPALGDIYSNTQTSYIEVYTSSGWSQLGVIPSIPTIGTATDVGTSRAYNNAAASVTFTPGSGGGLVTTFTITSNPGSITASGSSSPIVVTGLSSNTAYTFNVTATNPYGNAVPSNQSSSITATSIPQVVSGVTATPGNLTASVAFTPGATGGKSVTYTVTPSPSTSPSTFTGASSPISVTGLTQGTSYTFGVVASNANGSASSVSSSSMTAFALPGAPTIGTATNNGTGRVYNNGAASVTFSAPASNGGTSITGYTVTSSPGGYTGTGASSPITVTGLQSNTAYTFTVTATNAIGTSSASSASNSITATTLSQAPTIGTPTAAASSIASVPIFAPANNGGSAITGYTVTSNTGLTGTGSSSPITVSGLTGGQSYTFTVKATNANGTSPASAASSSLTMPSPTPSVDYLVVAGGAGGSFSDGYSGGGGAGGMLTGTSLSVAGATTYNVVVGSGGASSSYPTYYTGGNSSFSSVTSIGGGPSFYFNGGTLPPAGGSGGGGGYAQGGSSGQGTAGQGNNGGFGKNSTNASGGGGGGKSAAGSNASTTAGGAGGAGAASSYSGASVTYAGGGGGGSNGTPGAGGAGGGGAGTTNGTATAGTANTGGGGGGRGQGNPATGGSGVVIIRYGNSYPDAFTTGSPSFTNSGGFKIYRFTGTGSIIF
jgi:hypothetical protein